VTKDVKALFLCPQKNVSSHLNKSNIFQITFFVKVSVFGGYSDERGDAMRNSMSLLTALHETDRILEVSTPLSEYSPK
jgi:hypothetical protein